MHRLPKLLELAEVPGLALGVVENGRVWTRGFGRASASPGASVSEATVFEAVSRGKPLFAYVVLQLLDEGTLDPSRPLHDYLPTPEADNPLMRRGREQPGPLQPTSEPGTRFTYSGEGFFHLQRVVEHLAGVLFARLMRERVLEPFGMRESSYIWLPRFDGRKAAGRDQSGHEVGVYGALGRRADEIGRQWGKPVEEWRYEVAARAVPLTNPEWPVLPLYTGFLLRVVARPPARGLELRPESARAMTTPVVELNQVLSGAGMGHPAG